MDFMVDKPLLDRRYAAIGEKYVIILDNIIEKNSLTDFDKAILLPTKLKSGVAL